MIGKVFWVERSGRTATPRPPSTRSSARDSSAASGPRRWRARRRSHSPTALVRDVAYGQISRPDRMEKHGAVARWIEGLGRPDDHAEMLAYHWRSSLDLARASGRETPELIDETRLALRNAGDRAVALNAFRPAEAYYREALVLWPDEASDRADLLFRHAHALYIGADERRERALEEARDALLVAGDTDRAAEAEAYLSRMAWFAGHRDAANAHLDRAAELLEGAGPSVGKVRVLSFAARMRFLGGEGDEDSAHCERRARVGERASARGAPRACADDHRVDEEPA